MKIKIIDALESNSELQVRKSRLSLKNLAWIHELMTHQLNTSNSGELNSLLVLLMDSTLGKWIKTNYMIAWPKNQEQKEFSTKP